MAVVASAPADALHPNDRRNGLRHQPLDRAARHQGGTNQRDQGRGYRHLAHRAGRDAPALPACGSA
jgi:hypothetical protein